MVEVSDKDIEIIIEAMRERSCCDFSNYSPNSLKRRIAKILTEEQLKIGQLAMKIREDSFYAEKVVKNITVCTTELFRDPEVWISLGEEMLNICKYKPALNIWHAGCSTGQEVYSMMILLCEANLFDKCDIYASDINEDALSKASDGKYRYLFNKNYIENFNQVFNSRSGNKEKTNYNKYFTIDTFKDVIQMKPFLINKPVYKKTDLVKDDNPFNVIFDIIICRNVIIYFNYELQNKVFNLFYRNLSNTGCIILGAHESIIGPYSSVFEKIFQGYFKKIPK